MSPSLSRLEVQITRGLQKSNDFGGVDIKQQRRRVLQPSLLSSEEFVMQSHSFHCFKKRVEGLRPKPPKVSISIVAFFAMSQSLQVSKKLEVEI